MRFFLTKSAGLKQRERSQGRGLEGGKVGRRKARRKARRKGKRKEGRGREELPERVLPWGRKADERQERQESEGCSRRGSKDEKECQLWPVEEGLGVASRTLGHHGAEALSVHVTHAYL